MELAGNDPAPKPHADQEAGGLTLSDLSEVHHLLGVHPDLDIDAYHGGEGISKTGLDHIAHSPFRFHGLHMHPNRPASKRKAGQLEGALAHCATLEPHSFDSRYVVVRDGAPNKPTSRQLEAKKPSDETLKAIEWWKEFEAEHAGKEVITAQQYDAAWRQAENIRALPDVAFAMANGTPEMSAFWRDPITGVLCRCRPDWTFFCGDNKAVILDVKTYSDASPGEFWKQVLRKRYHVQDSYYTDGFSIASGLEVVGFTFVVVETDWPYEANVLMLDDNLKAEGRRLYRRDLDVYAECLRTGCWPQMGNSIQLVNAPRRARKSTHEE
jgi:exodeoxyribonuclease VIII